VVGKLKEKVDAPSKTDIPWLLITAASTSGTGAMSQVKSIQRVETRGGKAPIEGCDQANAGKQARIDYAAKYYFYR
jgi:hypothetical protein